MTHATNQPSSDAPPDDALSQQLRLLVEQLILAHKRAHNATLPDSRSGLHIQTNRRIEQGRAQAFKSALQLVLHHLQPYITTQHKELINGYQLNHTPIQRPGPDPDPPTPARPPTPGAAGSPGR